MVDFQNVYDKYKDTDLNLMMINGTDGQRETRELADQLFDENGYSMPIYYDEALAGKGELDINQSANAAYRITGYPTTAFIDREGNLAGYYTGALDKKRLEKLVEFLMDDNNIGKPLADAFN